MMNEHWTVSFSISLDIFYSDGSAVEVSGALQDYFSLRKPCSLSPLLFYASSLSAIE